MSQKNKKGHKTLLWGERRVIFLNSVDDNNIIWDTYYTVKERLRKILKWEIIIYYVRLIIRVTTQ